MSKKASRRSFLSYAVTAVVVGVVAGVGGYYAGLLGVSPVEVTKTSTVTTTRTAPGGTETTTITRPPVTTTVTQPPVTQTVTTTVAPPSEELDPAIVEAAKREGKIRFVACIPVSYMEEVKKRFEAKYPEITVEYTRLGADVGAKILAEKEAGVHNVDVSEMPVPIAAYSILPKKKEYHLSYIPPSAQIIADRWKDPEGYWVATHVVLHTLAYNTELVKPEDRPTLLTDLADPKWKERSAFYDIGGADMAVYILNTMEQRFGLDWVKKWAENRPILSGTSMSVCNAKVATGEALVCWSTLSLTVSAIIGGAHVDWMRAANDHYFYEYPCWSIYKDAPNPNAAKVFYNYAFSKDGAQLVIDTMGLPPTRPDVTLPDPSIADISKLELDYIEALPTEQTKELREKYLEIFA